jgi:outer membrane lipoprotein-sorting protein
MTRLLLLPFFALHLLAAQEIRTSDELIKAMHDRYAKKWYKTLTFVQKTTQYRSDTTIGTWYEAFSFPGTMRIDMDSVESDGMIISRDSLYYFQQGKLATTRYFVHSLLLLGFDVYFLPPEETLAKLKGLHFDLSIVHEDTWQGRPVIVVGAKKEELHSPQFWVDKERLYFVRLLEPAGQDGSQTRETQFNKYARLSEGWIAAEVVFKVNDKVLMTEEYSRLRANPRLDPRLFEPQNWKTARWR